ncbi:MAG: DNA polymerase III subunit delta [Bacteroidales bacterium]
MLFHEIAGHRAIKDNLIKTVRDGRISHAQLFLGPNGNGKFALALAYAQYANCTNRKDTDSCGECPSCVKFNILAHPDLHFIYPVAQVKDKKKPKSRDFITHWREYIKECSFYPSLNEWYEKINIERKQGIINVRDADEIIRTLNYTSYESIFKIVIIWMAEKFHHQAAPKILKILEEPPEKTIFILIAEKQEDIINTILSRTQIIKIPRIPDNDLYKKLTSNNAFNENEVKNAVRISEGNYKKAIHFLRDSGKEQFYFENFQFWMRLCFKVDILKLDDFISDFSQNPREELKQFFLYALKATRNSLLFNYHNERIIRLPGEEYSFNKKISPFINHKNGQEFIELFEKAHDHIERNANPAILFTSLSLKIIDLLKMKA